MFVGVLYTKPTSLAHAARRVSRATQGNFFIPTTENRPTGTVADGAAGIGCDK